MSLIGWYTESVKKTPQDRIAEAVAYYQNKYDITPNYCEVHKDFPVKEYPGIEIAPKQSVYTPNLFYIGIKD